MLAPQKESIFGCSCRLWLLSWRRARIFARSCSLLSKYLPISWKQRKEQSHAQCHVTHRIRIFDKISEHVKVAKSVDIAVPELAVTIASCSPCDFYFKHVTLSVEHLRSQSVKTRGLVGNEPRFFSISVSTVETTVFPPGKRTSASLLNLSDFISVYTLHADLQY